MQRTVRVPGAKVALSTASCYPETCTTAFEMAADLGFDGVEVMVWTDPVSQDPDALRGLSDRFGVPVLAIHAPCLLLTQRVWSTDPWTKLLRAQVAAERVGAGTVVVHPAVPLAAGVRPHLRRRVAPDAERDRRDLRGREHVPVEGAQPGGRGLPAALGPAGARLPGHHAGPVAHRRLGLRRGTRGGGVGRPASARHLADGSGSNKDEHLVPGRGGQPCAEVLERLARGGYDGTVVLEVNTRRAVNRDEREADLAEGLAFARLNLAAAAGSASGP
jgi:sugar phosphate isomerase/epimerase